MTTPSAVWIQPRGEVKSRTAVAVVARVVIQLRRLQHLNVVQLREQQNEQQHDDKTKLADLTVHATFSGSSAFEPSSRDITTWSLTAEEATPEGCSS